MSAVIALKSFELYKGVQEVEATREIASSFRSLNILQIQEHPQIVQRSRGYLQELVSLLFLLRWWTFADGSHPASKVLPQQEVLAAFSFLGGFMWSVVLMEYDGSCILKKSFTIWIYLQEAKHPALFDRKVGETSRGGRERRSRGGGREKDSVVSKSFDGDGGSCVCNRQQQYLSPPRLLLHNFCRENLELKQRWYRASLLHRPRILLREVVCRKPMPQQELKEMAEKKFADRHRF